MLLLCRSALESSPGTEITKAVVPLRSVTHHKAQVPKMRFKWSSDPNFKILNPPNLLPSAVFWLLAVHPTSLQAGSLLECMGIPGAPSEVFQIQAMTKLCLQTGFAGSFLCLAASPGGDLSPSELNPV